MFGKQTQVEAAAATSAPAAAATPGKTTQVQQVDTGNRPEPAASTDPGYVLRSEGARIIEVGDPAVYRVEQVGSADGAPPPAARWEVVNDPAEVAAGHATPLTAGPIAADRWRAAARLPGHYVIKAYVNGSELSYAQEVAPPKGFPVSVPAGAAQAPLATIADFIALVKRVEAAYGGRPWQDIVTRMRKEYYPGPTIYQQVLEPFTWNALIDEQSRLPGLEVPPVAMSDLAALRDHAVVTGPSGEAIDIGHILTGVDSYNFPHVSGTFAKGGIEGPAAASWGGDVGSALAKWAVDGVPGDQSKQDFYNLLANPADMLGDVDGLALAHGPNLSLPPSASLSRRLEAFYQTAPDTGPKQRYHQFCRGAHFTLAGNVLDDASRARIKEQVTRFAHAFNHKGKVLDPLGFGRGVQPPGYETSTQRIDREAGWFANRFIAWIHQGLASEGG